MDKDKELVSFGALRAKLISLGIDVNLPVVNSGYRVVLRKMLLSETCDKDD